MQRANETTHWRWVAVLAALGGCGDHHLVGADYGHDAGGEAGAGETAGRHGSAGRAGGASLGASGAGAGESGEGGEGGAGNGEVAGAPHASGGASSARGGQDGGGRGANTGGMGESEAGGTSAGQAGASGEAGATGGVGASGGAGATGGAAGQRGTPDCIELGNCEVPPKSPLVANWDDTCFLRSNGRAECWGVNYSAWPGGPVPESTPGGVFVDISGGGGGICGVGTTGEIVCFGNAYLAYAGFSHVANWGSVWVGLHADGTIKALSDFTGVGNYGLDASARFKSVVMGDGGPCGLHANGSATCWPLSHVSIGGGARHTCLATIDGTLQCWGDDSDGQASPANGGNFTQVSAGTSHSCAVKATGELACWGSNAYGQATPPPGNYDSVAAAADYACASDVPTRTIRCWGNVPFPASVLPTNVYPALAAGDTHVCALTRPVTCFGGNGSGQATPPPNSYMAALAAGSAHNCGIIDNDNSGVHQRGDIVCWGNNAYGQATPPAGAFVDIVAGREHTCARAATGTVSCWGRNDLGQATPPSGHFVAIGAGGSHSCAVSVTGETACWGDASFGQLKPPPPPTFSELALGGSGNNSRTWAWGSIVCGVRTDGTSFCTNADQSLAALPVADLHGFAIGAQNMLVTSCALRADQSAVCWGKDSASLVPPSGAFEFVTVGDSHACGLRPNGTITCWGNDGKHQLAVPVDVAGP